MRAYLLISLFVLFFNYFTSKGQDSKSESEFAKILEPTRSRSISIRKLSKSYYEMIKQIDDTSGKNQLQKKIDSLEVIEEVNDRKELDLVFKFIRQHPNSSLCLDILDFRMHRSEGFQLYDSFYRAYNLLTKYLQISKKGKQLKADLVNFKNSNIGKEAPSFTLNDINNRKLSFSSFRNKNYILIDFWASWCIPCRADFPFLKELYKKYSSKGLEIINISRDDNIQFWKTAIKNDGIDIWKQISTKQNDDNILKHYFVNAIPLKFLINKQGVIIGKWLGTGEVNNKEIKMTLDQIFE